jgi:hypothetical protein
MRHDDYKFCSVVPFCDSLTTRQTGLYYASTWSRVPELGKHCFLWLPGRLTAGARGRCSPGLPASKSDAQPHVSVSIEAC